ncbi:phospho-sugar mutase [Couchioplanes caeruleus]|uniref:Phosphomannomutase n=2 Tax=Couchioplanes caeruleus TaxID=56438 RepID=A0A1K0F9E9_9ACTN|nr:phospho-sugar mutase [Couchioplanes caeruleus]OJF09479.1 phosphomannomutase [Couchioplanes caeruleus subsp. caeruleus]ROP31916.1 phosphomannomutase [Couchioplanes caeruleus]
MATTDDLRKLAETWLADDPDPAGRDEIRALLDRLPDSAAELADRFAGPLTFGTAGLRGRLRAGPNGMNLAVVTRAAAGLVGWLAAQGGEGPLIIGYDARHGSRQFAEQTARVATATGREALVLPRPLPTPVLAYAVRKLDAVAGVMVTASHNPPQDNGYKVYLGAQLGGPGGAGAQIVPPADAGIEAAIQAVGTLAEVKLGDPGTVLGEDIVQGYVDSAAAVIPAGARELKVAYTPLHGVGGRVLVDAFTAAGFAAPAVVAEQFEPDPEFTTVAFPNPEEPGAMDLLLALATAENADLAIANDPDADRCAVAIPAGEDGGWRPLRGDELGLLLADQLIRRGTPGTYATTIVSSTQLKALCAARDAPYAETLTGFKWIVRGAEELAFGYEEALGYCVAPDLVRDKDGITAALTVAELAAGLKAEGKSLRDRLDELDTELGVHRTDQVSVRVDDLTEITRAMAHVRANPPATLLGQPVTEVEDRAPAADVLTLRTSGVRVVIRPSGTEPKLKAYLEVVEPVGKTGKLANAQFRSGVGMAQLRKEVSAALGL